MPWVEQLESQSHRINQLGSAEAERTFKIWQTTLDIIPITKTKILQDPSSILDESGQGLPDLGSTWNAVSAVGPTTDAISTTLTLYEYDVRTDKTNTWVAVAKYTNDPARTTKTRKYSLSRYNQNVTIPWARLRTIEDISTSNKLNGWHEMDAIQYPASFLRLQFTLTLPKSLTKTFIQKTGLQQNKLHVFGGLPWLFLEPDLQWESAFYNSITYTWVNDPGNPSVAWPQFPPIACPNFSLGNPTACFNHQVPQSIKWDSIPGTFSFLFPINLINATLGVNKTWVRPPFHDVQLLLSPCPGGCPRFTIYSPNLPASNGWRELPGADIFPSEIFY